MGMVEPATLLAPLLAFFIAAASPGPATLATAATAMAGGRGAGMMLGLGLSLGIAFWGTLTAVGLGALILAWAPALIGLKIAGGLYLLYLAWKSAQGALAPDSDAMEGRAVNGRNMILRGLMLNLMNPKAVLAWTAVIALGLPPQGAGAYLIAIVVLCALMAVAIYAGYALLFSAPPVRAAYARFRRWCEGLFALGFGLAGLRLILWRSPTT